MIFEHAYEKTVLDNVFLHLGDVVENVDVYLKMENSTQRDPSSSRQPWP